MEASGGANGGSEAAQPSKNAAKPYTVLKEVELDLSDPEALVAKLREEFAPVLGADAKLEALVRVGRAQQTEPVKALQTVAELRGLNGEHVIVADRGFTKKSVKTETKTTATVS